MVEVRKEVESRGNLPGLLLDKTFALVYDLPLFFYTHRSNRELADRVTQGLEMAHADGSLLTLFRAHMRGSLRFAEMPKRRVFRLNTPPPKGIDFDYRRYDLDLTNMTDLELLLQLYRTVPASWHLGTPLHDYLKLTVSMSNGPGVTEKMLRSKREMLRRLETGHYTMADPAGPEGMAAFLRLSLTAEETYPAAAAARPGLLFEDHLEPLLREFPVRNPAPAIPPHRA